MTTTKYPLRVQILGLNNTSNHYFKPIGYHLRWFVPKSVGYPYYGYKIYFLYQNYLHNNLKRNEISFEGQQFTIHSNWAKKNKFIKISDDATLIFEEKIEFNNSGIKIFKGNRNHFLISFSSPVIDINLKFNNTQSENHDITVFYSNSKIGIYPLQSEVAIKKPNITSILIPVCSCYLVKLSYITEEMIINLLNHGSLNVNPLHDIPSPDQNTPYNLINNQFQICNYFLKECNSIESFMKKYKETDVIELIEKYHLVLRNHSETVLLKNSYGLEEKPVSIFNFIQFTSLDPNIAKFLGLYWVDRDSSNRGAKGIYVIRADYPNKKYVYGFHYNNCTETEILPHINGKIILKQLPGITYNGRIPLGRISLKCIRKDDLIFYSSHKPVFLDIKSNFTKQVTKTYDSKNKYDYTDENIPIGKEIFFDVTPVDIFGRCGKTYPSNKLTLVDLEHPVPPKNIKAAIHQTGYPWHNPYYFSEQEIKKGYINLTFEYGDTQHKISPDAKEIQLLWAYGNPKYPSLNYNQETEGFDEDWKKLGEPIPIKNHVTSGFTILTNNTINSFIVKQIILTDKQNIPKENMLQYSSLDVLTDQEVNTKRFQVELLLNHPISEPHIFDGYIVNFKNAQYTIYESSAGLGYDDDITEKKDLTARLFLLLSDSLELIDESHINVSIEIIHPSYLNASSFSTVSVDDLIEHNGYIIDDDNIFHFLTTEPDKVSAEKFTPLLNICIENTSGPMNTNFNFGELAIDFSYIIQGNNSIEVVGLETLPEKQTDIILTKLVSIPVINENKITYLVRVKPLDYLKLMKVIIDDQNIKFKCFVYEPFLLENISLGLEGEEGDIELNMDKDPMKKIWFTGYATDDSEKKSLELALPFESRVIRPPSLTKPTTPYPCADHNAVRAFVSAPKYDGFSKVGLRWDDNSDKKFEVARSNANSIIAADKQNWLMGNDTDHLEMDRITITSQIENFDGNIELKIVEIDNYKGNDSLKDSIIIQNDTIMKIKENKNGENNVAWIVLKKQENLKVDNEEAQLYKIPAVPKESVEGELKSEITINNNGTLTFEPLISSRDIFHLLQKCIYGRFSCKFNDDNKKSYFQVLNVNMEEFIKITCKPYTNIEFISNKEIRNGTEFICEAPYDYSLVLESDFALKRLADVQYKNGMLKNINAFGIVSKMPVTGNSFVDKSVIGIGSSRYFYKIREVSPGNSVSKWSDCSVGFYQLDLHKPLPPINLKVKRNLNAIELIWDVTTEIDYHKVAFNRYEGNSNIDIDNLEPIKTEDVNQLNFLPLRLHNQKLIMTQKLKVKSSESEILNQIILKATNSNIDLIVRNKSSFDERNRIITDVNPLIVDNTPVFMMLQYKDDDKPTKIKYVPYSNNQSIKVIENKIDLNFIYPEIISIEAVYQSILFPENVSLDEVDAPNLLDDENNPPEIDLEKLIISNFDPVLNNTSVVVIIKKSNNELEIIKSQPGTVESLKIKNGRIQLKLDIKWEYIKGVFLEDNKYYTDNNWNKRSILLTELSKVFTLGNFITSMENLNPLISNTTDLVLNYCDEVVVSDRRYFYWKNEFSDIENLNFNNQLNYYIKNIKYTPVSYNKKVPVYSNNSNITSINIEDRRVPSAPIIISVITDGVLTIDGQEYNVLLTIDKTSADISFEYKYSDEVSWKDVQKHEIFSLQDTPIKAKIFIPFKEKKLVLRALSYNSSNIQSDYSSNYIYEK